MQQGLFLVGCLILATLGIVHLFFTFFSDRFLAVDERVTAAMKETSPRLTRETTMWKAWVGFNASHSLGPIMFSLFYVPLAVTDFGFISESLWLSALPILVGVSYLALARAYWFRIPLMGIGVATICFVASFVLGYV